MPFEAKASFLNSVEHELYSILTAQDMSKALSVISDQLLRFSMTELDITKDDNDDLLNAFISAMEIQGRSYKTINRYKYIITKMTKQINVPTRQITIYHLRQYLAQEKERGIGDRTLEGLRQIFSTYFNWLHRESLIDKNPVVNLGTIKYSKRVKPIYSDTDIERLKDSCKTTRDKAIICFLLSTGCRISEMIELDIEDINFRTLECIVHGKGDKERTVYMSEVAGMLIKNYLESRNDDNPALFVTRTKERINPGGVRFMLRNLANKTGVEKVHPHKFRRTLATNLIKHGMPIQEVATILGHDKLDTTMQYIAMDNTIVKNDYRRFC